MAEEEKTEDSGNEGATDEMSTSKGHRRRRDRRRYPGGGWRCEETRRIRGDESKGETGGDSEGSSRARSASRSSGRTSSRARSGSSSRSDVDSRLVLLLRPRDVAANSAGAATREYAASLDITQCGGYSSG